MEPSLRQHLTAGATWRRGVFMLVFVVIYSLAELLVAAVAVFQFLAVLFTGRPHARLEPFARSLSLYVFQVVQFFTFGREEKPFPFSPWPDADLSAPPGRSPRKRRPAKRRSNAAGAAAGEAASGEPPRE